MGQRAEEPLGNPRKPWIFWYFSGFWRYFRDILSNTRVFGKNNVIVVEQENKDLGFVGKPKMIFKEKIQAVIEKSFIPILSPMGKDDNNQKYNIYAWHTIFKKYRC